MKHYQATFKEVTTYRMSLEFALEVEGELTESPFDLAINHLQDLLSQDEQKVKEMLNLDDEDTIYVEDEPDWDTLPGGKDYD